MCVQFITRGATGYNSRAVCRSVYSESAHLVDTICTMDSLKVVFLNLMLKLCRIKAIEPACWPRCTRGFDSRLHVDYTKIQN